MDLNEYDKIADKILAVLFILNTPEKILKNKPATRKASQALLIFKINKNKYS